MLSMLIIYIVNDDILKLFSLLFLFLVYDLEGISELKTKTYTCSILFLLMFNDNI